MLSRKLLLDTLIKYKNLTASALCSSTSLGHVADAGQVTNMLQELQRDGFVKVVDGVTPDTYIITGRGIREGKRLGWNGMLAVNAPAS
jgi:hypothetical protein